MRKRIAVLVTGAIRNSTDLIVENIRHIKKVFGHMDVHVYFHTWDTNADYKYSEEDFERIRNEVHFCMTSPPLNREWMMTVLDGSMHKTNVGYGISSMFYAIYQLSNVVRDRYDYVCRLRNDLCIDDNFNLWFDLLDRGVAQYVSPISLYTYNDACNDHFGITTQENFRKVWHGSWFDLLRDLREINECPEKTILAKMNRHGIKIYYTIPLYYRLKETEMILDGHVQMHTVNMYMIEFIRGFVPTHSDHKFYCLN